MSIFESKILPFLYRICIPVARVSFFVVYFYFGLLKLLGLSPAEELVQQLWASTIPFVSFNAFQIFFACFEMLIGIVFLIPGKERLALYLLIPHMITTFGPLVLLPKLAWKEFMVPTLVGMYIIKNLILIALGIAIASHIGSFRSSAMRKAATT